MNKKLLIGCDADGVLTDLTAHNLRAGQKSFHREPVRPEAYALDEMFDVRDIPKPLLYLKAFGIYRRYSKNEPPRSGAAEVIRELTQAGCAFHSITARKFATSRNLLGSLARKWYLNWLKQNGIPFQSVQFCDEIRSPQDKLLACRKLGVDAMIEDRSDNALYLAENGVRVILIETAYNSDAVHENIIRVQDWNGVKAAVSALEAVDCAGFAKLEREQLAQLDDAAKTAYFRKYQRYLQQSDLDAERFRKGDRRFRLLYGFLRLPVRLFYSVKVFGWENLPYQDGFIIACNHCDSADQYRLGLALGNRPFVGYAAKEIERTFRGTLFQMTGLGLFIDRSDAADKKRAAEQMASYVAHDRIAFIFPEGTRKNKTPEGRARFQNPFKAGTAVLSQKTGAGILPVAVNSFGRQNYVRFGEPVFVAPTDDIDSKTKALAKEIAALSMENITLYLTKRNQLSVLEAEKKRLQGYITEIDHKG